MWDVLCRSKNLLSCIFLSGIIFLVCAGIVEQGSFSNIASVHAMGTNRSYTTGTSCPLPSAPISQSLLVVLLDRSGSLTYQPGATDPNGYSTSVTKALADLWPGLMTVIPFSNNATPVLGPATLSDPTQQADLKNRVEQYPIGGTTPLGPAMHVALNQLKNAAAGSRAIIITDGNPTGVGDNDGAHQEQDIRKNLISQFCSQGIPLSAFGLTIDPSTSDGQDANHLLTDITNGTGATYINVRSPEELAKAVVSLYAEWQDLNFTQESAQNGNFPVSIDTFAKQVNIITFRSDSNYQVTLDAPDGQPVQGVQPSTDRHYVIDTLAQGVFVAGAYTIHTNGDPDAQVYALVKSPLQVQINAPTAQTLPYGKPIDIEAAFLDGNNLLTPIPGQAQVIAHIKFLKNGQQVGTTNDVILAQQGATFKGQTLVYKQVGEIQIEVNGSYQGVQRQTTTSFQLVTPPIPPSPPPPPCRLGFVGCLLLQVQHFWTQHRTQILLYGLLGLLLLLLLFWLTKPSPFGALERGNHVVPLGRGRSLGRRLFSKSVIPSGELAGAFDFKGAAFNLIFKRGRRAYIRAKRDMPPITVKCVDGDDIAVKRGRRVELHDEDEINIAGLDVATFRKSIQSNTNDEFFD